MILEATNRLTGFEHFYGLKDVNNNDDDSDDDNCFDGKDNYNDDIYYDGKDANDDNHDDDKGGLQGDDSYRVEPPTRGKALRARAITTIDASSIKTDTHTKHSLENTKKIIGRHRNQSAIPSIVFDFVSITLFL